MSIRLPYTKILACAVTAMLAAALCFAMTGCSDNSDKVVSEAALTKDDGTVVMMLTNKSQDNLIIREKNLTLNFQTSDGKEFKGIAPTARAAFLPAGETVYMTCTFNYDKFFGEDLQPSRVSVAVHGRLKVADDADISEKNMDTHVTTSHEENVYKAEMTSQYTGSNERINGYREVIFLYGIDAQIITAKTYKNSLTDEKTIERTFEKEVWEKVDSYEIHVYPAVV